MGYNDSMNAVNIEKALEYQHLGKQTTSDSQTHLLA